MRETLNGVEVEWLDADGPALGSLQSGLDLLGDSFGQSIEMFAIPVKRLDADFLRLGQASPVRSSRSCSNTASALPWSETFRRQSQRAKRCTISSTRRTGAVSICSFATRPSCARGCGRSDQLCATSRVGSNSPARSSTG